MQSYCAYLITEASQSPNLMGMEWNQHTAVQVPANCCQQIKAHMLRGSSLYSEKQKINRKPNAWGREGERGKNTVAMLLGGWGTGQLQGGEGKG